MCYADWVYCPSTNHLRLTQTAKVAFAFAFAFCYQTIVIKTLRRLRMVYKPCMEAMYEFSGNLRSASDKHVDFFSRNAVSCAVHVEH